VGAEVQKRPETLEVANVLLSFRANRIEVIQRAVGVIIIISVARRREILNKAVQETFRMFKIEGVLIKIELSRKTKKNKQKSRTHK
jgi:hypothetical protein